MCHLSSIKFWHCDKLINEANLKLPIKSKIVTALVFNVQEDQIRGDRVQRWVTDITFNCVVFTYKSPYFVFRDGEQDEIKSSNTAE